MKSCGATQESVCTKGKHAFGTLAGSCQTGATFSSKQTATAVDPTAKVWRGSHEERVESQGIIVLGTPVGHKEFVKQEFMNLVAEHSNFLLKFPEVEDLQCAWLLLLLWCCEGEFLHQNCAS